MLSSSTGEIITCEATSCWHDDKGSYAVLNVPKLTDFHLTFTFLLRKRLLTAHPI